MFRSMLSSYLGNADAFPILKQWDYFNHAGVSPWAPETLKAVNDFNAEFARECFMMTNWMQRLETFREELAGFINAQKHEIAFTRNTGDAIAIIAAGIDWKAGDRVVVPSCEYPSNVYPWMDARDRHGVELISVEEETDTNGIARVEEDDLIRACEHHRTKLLAVSHVQWTNGQRMNLKKLGAYCRDKGILFAVDAIQSLGVVPMDVQAAHIDFLFSGGHKWLMSPPGSGLIYCRQELIERVNSPMVGAASVINPWRWEINFVRSPDAQRFETGTPAFSSLFGMQAAVKVLKAVGIDAIHAQVKSLGDQFAAGARAKGYTVISDRSGEVGGAVCFTSPAGNSDDLVKMLRETHKVELAARKGRLRFSPHFYNTAEQVARTLAVLPAH
jgi:cysteine desulfurase / selenocysteine lyase